MHSEVRVHGSPSLLSGIAPLQLDCAPSETSPATATQSTIATCTRRDISLSMHPAPEFAAFETLNAENWICVQRSV